MSTQGVLAPFVARKGRAGYAGGRWVVLRAKTPFNSPLDIKGEACGVLFGIKEEGFAKVDVRIIH